jgi:hypothetical protein
VGGRPRSARCIGFRSDWLQKGHGPAARWAPRRRGSRLFHFKHWPGLALQNSQSHHKSRKARGYLNVAGRGPAAPPQPRSRFGARAALAPPANRCQRRQRAQSCGHPKQQAQVTQAWHMQEPQQRRPARKPARRTRSAHQCRALAPFGGARHRASRAFLPWRRGRPPLSITPAPIAAGDAGGQGHACVGSDRLQRRALV